MSLKGNYSALGMGMGIWGAVASASPLGWMKWETHIASGSYPIRLFLLRVIHASVSFFPVSFIFSFIYSTNIYCFSIASHFIFALSAKLVPWDFPSPDLSFHSVCHYLNPFFFCLFVYYSVCLHIVKFKLYEENKFCVVPCQFPRPMASPGI